MEPRLILPGTVLSDTIRFSEADERHIFRSLRLRKGGRIVIADGNGCEALCELTADRAAKVLETRPSKGEPPAPVHLYPSLSKGDRFDRLLQKAVEFGVTSVTPVLSERCVAGVPSPVKWERYRKIMRSAAEQSGRGIIPELRDALDFKDAGASARGLRIFCYENEHTISLRAVFREGVTETSVMTGPEGGYTEEEAAFAEQNGWKSVSLGNTILRCETAPLMPLAAIRFLSMLTEGTDG
jgi:16S rRNA (uracil1498-N3)-methyltransferase